MTGAPFIIYSCSKGGGDGTPAPSNPCTGLTMIVNGAVTNPATTLTSNGGIAASASGGESPYTYSLNSGTFQSSATFSSLGVGFYTITAKDANGCTGISNAKVVNQAAGPMLPTGLLPLSERQKITNRINAGGRYSD